MWQASASRRSLKPMPVVRPSSSRRSARLQALQKPPRQGQKSMDQVNGPVTHGRGGKSRGKRSSTPAFQIQWQSAPARTQKVVDHLRNHPADCRILFYSDGKQSHTDGDRPSGKDKVSICAVIAKCVFKDNEEYADLYAAGPDKFRDSVNNHITSLRKRYHECYDKLHATGAGIMPHDAQILKEFPWYDDLLGVMGGNPALSLKTISSRPGMDHAANYFSISRTAGSSYSESLCSGSAQFGAQPDPISADTTSAQSPSGPYPPPYSGQSYPPPSGGSPYLPAADQSYPSPVAGQLYSPHTRGPYPSPAGGHHYFPQPSGNPYLDCVPQPPQPLLPHTSNSLLDDDDDDDMSYFFDLRNDDEERMDFSDIRPPTPPAQHDYRNERDVTILDSPPKSKRAASKRPLLPSSPSPPITPPPPSGFVLPHASKTSHRDSRASFGDPGRRTSMASLKLVSRCSSGSSRSKPASVSSAPASTAATSPANSASATGKQRQGKKQRSSIQDTVEKLNNEIESVQSERVTWEELKNERYMFKYNIIRQANEHKFLQAERVETHAEAAAAHKRSLEAKDTEIRLREAETKMHDALALAHAEEAETLHLKIEYARLTGSSSGS
ncbi:hypothetical protein CY34DRAFT_110879 [Suillus luteus UH-Slu-Lm8-n1]|uniref:Uncharacterized protein n=1 Tax=Suillus luteus UH-Slu-Lm8-n1 TaxID=930992 RepID=A0A0D0AEQ9_9AGAM|nr:hypothetical protein CY34DRAFT_110879 [Suillus luteus UH-Slu-Lm8-n1]